MKSVLTLSNVRHRFTVRGRAGKKPGELWAVDSVDLSVGRGETVGIVGESGSGKSTLGLIAAGLLHPTEGTVQLDGLPFKSGFKPGRVQMVFQDPISSLDPRMRIESILSEPMRAEGKLSKHEQRERMSDLLLRVGLQPEHLGRRRTQLSGGQCQRAAIARAMTTRPDLVVLDEPTSSLDVIVQARILNLLVDLQEQYGSGYLFISHNLRVVEAVSHRVLVLYQGHVVEEGQTATVLAAPQHPYTRALEAAAPDLLPALQASTLDLPPAERSERQESAGCPYAPRCPLALPICWEQRPPLLSRRDGHRVACHVVNSDKGVEEAAALRGATSSHVGPSRAIDVDRMTLDDDA